MIVSAISKHYFHHITMNFRRVKPLVNDDDSDERDQDNFMSDSLEFQGASEAEISGSDDGDMTGSDNELKDGDDDMDMEGEESNEEERVHFCIPDPAFGVHPLISSAQCTRCYIPHFIRHAGKSPKIHHKRAAKVTTNPKRRLGHRHKSYS